MILLFSVAMQLVDTLKSEAIEAEERKQILSNIIVVDVESVSK